MTYSQYVLEQERILREPLESLRVNKPLEWQWNSMWKYEQDKYRARQELLYHGVLVGYVYNRSPGIFEVQSTRKGESLDHGTFGDARTAGLHLLRMILNRLLKGEL